MRRSLLLRAAACSEEMEGASLTVTAATGCLGPVLMKLKALLRRSDYKLQRGTQRDIKFVRSNFNSMHSLLWMICERDDLDPADKELKMEVLDLAEDMEDVVHDFVLSLAGSKDSNGRPVQNKTQASPFEQFRKNVNDISRRCHSKWKTAHPILSFCSRKKEISSHGKRRSPFILKDEAELLGEEEITPQLLESLRIVYDDLPHQMMKTCLLYCSLYPQDHPFDRDQLVRQWITERFVYEDEAAQGYFEELVNRRLILEKPVDSTKRLVDSTVSYILHPKMRNYLRRKSSEDNFIIWSSDIPSSCPRRIRRLCIDHSSMEVEYLSELDWAHIRSLVVFSKTGSIVPFEKLERLELLDFQGTKGIVDHHMKDICGVRHVRHLLGLSGSGYSEIPPEIAGLQNLETLEVSGIKCLPSELGSLHQLKTLLLRDNIYMEELPREIGKLLQLKTLVVINHSYDLKELPMEIGDLKQLETLDLSWTGIELLPKEIRKLQRLKTLNLNGSNVKELPKEIGKLQHLKQLLLHKVDVRRIPRGVVGLKELQILKLDETVATAIPLEVCLTPNLMELPEWIEEALRNNDVVSLLSRENLSFRNSEWTELEKGLVVGVHQMHIPQWLREHFSALALLDISICKLEEKDLEILREMPNLRELFLRIQGVQRKPIAISGEGFARLVILGIDSRVPRITFQEGAMPKLQDLLFEFQFYCGPPNNDHLGINHLRSLYHISFTCNEAWYLADSRPYIRAMIDGVKKEAREHPNNLYVNAHGTWVEYPDENNIYAHITWWEYPENNQIAEEINAACEERSSSKTGEIKEGSRSKTGEITEGSSSKTEEIEEIES